MRAAPADSAGERGEQLRVAGQRERTFGVGQPADVVAQRHRAERREQKQHRGRRRRLGLQPARLRAQHLACLGDATGPQRELRPQRAQVGRDGADVAALGDREHALGLLEPCEPDLRIPGGEQVAGGLDQPAGALHGAGGELGGAQVGVRGRRETGARPGLERDAFQRGGHGFVCAPGAGGQLPRALGIVVGQRLRDRAVRGAPLDDAAAVVRGRPQQRVPERDLARPERDDPGRLGGLERVDLEPGGGQRPHHEIAAAHLGGGGDQQRAARVVLERLEAAGEHALERRAGRQRPLDRCASLELVVRSSAGISRSASGLPAAVGEHAPCDVLGHRLVAAGVEQLLRAVGGQRPDLQGLDAGHELARHRPLREQHRHALGAEPARGEPQRLERRLVEPLKVVDHAHDRPLLRREREQAEQRRADRQPRLRSGRLELQGTGERRRLRRGQPVAQAEHRPAQLGQPRERLVRLRLEPAHAQHRHAVGALERREQQGGLADPGLAAQHERGAPARAGGVQRAPDALQLHLTTDQHLLASLTRLRPRGHRRDVEDRYEPMPSLPALPMWLWRRAGRPLRVAIVVLAALAALGFGGFLVQATGCAKTRGATRPPTRDARSSGCAPIRRRGTDAPRGRPTCDRRSSARSTAMSPPGSRASARR